MEMTAVPANKSTTAAFHGAGPGQWKQSHGEQWQIIQGIPAWVQICGLDGTVEVVNGAAVKISGYSAMELAGKTWPYPWFEFPPGESALPWPGGQSTWPYSELSRHQESPLEFEVACRTRRGESIPLMVTLSLLEDQERRPHRVLLVAWELSRRKRLEAETALAQKIQAVNQLASGVAHDINNNLAVILGYSEYLSTRLQTQDQDVRQALSAIQEQSKDCANTVRRIQLFSMPVPRRHLASVDINDVILEVVDASRRPGNGPSHPTPAIRVETQLESMSPVQGYRAGLREALSSLISNAMDALPQGGAICLRTRQEKDMVAVEVKDNGVGIPAEDIDRIFDPFFTTKGPSRSGLGLSIVRNLVSQLGGTIQVASTSGLGSTFTIRLPVARLESAVPKVPSPMVAPAHSLRVLVVDDEPKVAGVLQTFLGSLGHRAMVCLDGATALEAFADRKFDLAVVDLGLPGMDGWELARRLDQQRPGFPILVATGWEVSLEDAQGRDANIRAVLKKPFDIRELAQAVDQAMGVAM